MRSISHFPCLPEWRVANRDRLTGPRRLLPAPRARRGAHMHVGSCMLFEGRRRRTTTRRARRGAPAPRAALPPAARVRPARPGPPGVGRRPALQPALPRPAHGAAERRPATSELKHLAGRAVLAAARPLQAAVGDVARRGRSRATASRSLAQDAPRARRRRSPASTSRPCCSTSRRIPTPPPERRPAVVPAARCRAGAQLLADALLERATVPAEIVRGVRARRAPPAPGRAASVLGDVAALGAFALPGARSAPPARSTCRSARTAASRGSTSDLGAVQGDQERARRDRQRRRAGDRRRRRSARYLRAHGHPTIDLELKAMVPVSVRGEAERGALGNQVAAVCAPLPVGATDPVERLALVRGEMDGPQGVRPGGRRPGC